MENKIYLNQEQIEGLKALVNHLDKQIQEDRKQREERQQQNSVENFKKFVEKHNGVIQKERESNTMKRIQEIDKKLLQFNHIIMDLKTEIAITEAKRKELLQERSNYVAELQAQLDKKGETANGNTY